MSKKDDLDLDLSRAADARENDERPALDHWSPATALETPPNVGGFRYRWIAEYVNGIHTPRNVQMAIREGYVRVAMKELPSDFVVDEDTAGDGYARTGGLILMKLPEKFAVQRQAYYQRRSVEAVSAADEMQGVAGRHAVHEDRGSRTVTGREAAVLLNSMPRG